MALQSHWQALRGRVRQRLNQPRLSHVHTLDGVQLASEATRRHVLARALCRFRLVDFSTLPRAEQFDFVQVQLAAWQPFARTDWTLVLGESCAMVWAWDTEALEQRCAAAGLAAQRLTIIPEPLLQAPAQHDGARLQTCVQGWEAQVWRAGQLRASHWWTQPPDEGQWLNFLRGAGAAPVDLPFAAASVEVQLVQARPWGQLRSEASLRAGQGLRWQAGLAIVLLLVGWASLYELRALWQVQARTQALEQQKAQLQEQIAPLLQAREEVLRSMAQQQQLLLQVNQPTALAVLTHVARVLAADPAMAATVVRELQWGNGQLRLALQVPTGISRVAYVQALESGGWLREVRELPAETVADRNWLVLQASAQGVPMADGEVLAAQQEVAP